MSFYSRGRRIHFGAEEQVQLEQGCQVQEEAVGDEADVVLAAVLQPVRPRATQTSHARAGCLRTLETTTDTTDTADVTDAHIVSQVFHLETTAQSFISPSRQITTLRSSFTFSSDTCATDSLISGYIWKYKKT